MKFIFQLLLRNPERLAAQLRQPKGLYGALVAWLMNKGNRRVNERTYDLLNFQGDDSILEIGFGNGAFFSELVAAVPDGRVAGMDFSTDMVTKAKNLNRSLLRGGRLDIREGSISAMPFEKDSFNKIATINTIYFWPNPVEDLREVHRVLKPGGLLVIGMRDKASMEMIPVTKFGFNLYDEDEVMGMLDMAGFEEIHFVREKEPDSPLSNLFALAQK